MTADHHGPDAPSRVSGYARRLQANWTHWRRSRPFWSGLLSVAGGLTILLLPANQYTILTLPGIGGLVGFLLGGLITALGALLWLRPEQHDVFGVAIVLLALASFIYTNLGGFLVGMVLSVLGGCFAFAWQAVEQASEPSHEVTAVADR